MKEALKRTIREKIDKDEGRGDYVMPYFMAHEFQVQQYQIHKILNEKYYPNGYYIKDFTGEIIYYENMVLKDIFQTPQKNE